jgi:hypothetical protein
MNLVAVYAVNTWTIDVFWRYLAAKHAAMRHNRVKDGWLAMWAVMGRYGA